MFACPHCQYENPLENRFCQRCGNPLRGLRAVITPAALFSVDRHNEGSLPTRDDKDVQNLAPRSERAEQADKPAMTVAALLTAENYLDDEKRYQLRYASAHQQFLSGETELEVVDCCPSLDSPIAILLGETEDDLDLVNTSLIESLPATAHPYLKLQEKIFPTVPELQAAWQVQSFTVLVMEDRSGWQHLADVCSSATIHPLELIHWFYEMLELWESLSTFEAEPSLLNSENLLIDEDQILCLERLYYRLGDRTYELKDLGLLWQSLLRRAALLELADLAKLAAAIGVGDIDDIPLIKERLAQLADTFQDPTDDLHEQAVETADPHGAPHSEDLDVAEVATTETPSPLPPEDSAAAPEPITSEPEIDDELLLAGLDDEDEDDTAEDNINELPTMALPMQLYRLDEAGRTHIGRQRDHNEDCFYVEAQLRRTDGLRGSSLKARGLYILCDGMGGQACGEIASMLAVETLQTYFATHWQNEEELPDEDTIRQGILKANQVIFDRNEAEERQGTARMGTTLVVLLVANNQAVVAHVGDSRLYGYTRQGLKQLTVDHEVGQREINRGVEPAIAYARPDAYQLTQALGPRSNAEVVPSITSLHVGQDSLFVLCSDGLSDNDLLENHTETHV
ncbi:MAG: serine/threonine phosphatase, partial [Cyanobacteria bacterium P01_H01_bin.58]